MKKKADKAFHNGDFKKAFKLYSKTVELEPYNYDLIACQIGAAINLGQVNDEIFSKCDYLINQDEKKAQVIKSLKTFLKNYKILKFFFQGYYLKGLAFDLAFKFDHAIDLFFKSLELEKDHSKVIVKNLIKSIGYYLNLGNIEELFKLNDPDTGKF